MASSKNTGLTLTLVFFVITTLISSVTAIMMYQENNDNVATQDADKKAAQQADATAKKALDDLDTLKKLIGHEFEVVGDPLTEGQDETVAGALVMDMKQYAGDLEEKTVVATLQNLHRALMESNQQLADKQKSFDELQERLAMLDKTQQDMRAEIDAARAEAEAMAQKVTEERRQQLDDKDDLIAEKQQEKLAAEGRADEAETELENYKVATEERMKNQKALIRHHAEELQEIKHHSFEKPDGLIVWTSRDKERVWINLGFADRLPQHMTFSVYKKDHNGVARTQDDVKGSIEVTKILRDHLAEARVVDAELFAPITTRDPIYSPLWSSGRSEKMAIVGFIDLDDDGRSDREKLRELITAAGATVEAEILDDGTTIPENADFSKLITSDVKFVIQGVMPKPTDSSIPEEQDQIRNVLSHYADMREAALDNGVRLLSLSDFLSFVGFRAERRLYRPGDDRGYRLKNGSRSAAVDETIKRIGDYGAGQTAGKYSRHPLLRRRSSTDQTSKRYTSEGSGSGSGSGGN